jgi:hypothetical protein
VNDLKTGKLIINKVYTLMKTNIITLRITRQLLAAVAIFAMTMISAQGLFAQTAQAASSVTNLQVSGIAGECALVGDTITVSATVATDGAQGHLYQYGYVIYWGDGTQYDSDTGTNSVPGFFTVENQPYNISHTHTYASEAVNNVITVAVYHQNPAGQDGQDEAEAQITICVVDENTKPVITLNGSDPVNLTVGDSYTDAGATASDAEDGVITDDIVVGGDTVDPNTVGTYVITYNVQDSEGLAADQMTRTVNVNPAITECNDGIDNDEDGDIDYPADLGCSTANDDRENTPPVITLTGNATVDIIIGNAYTEDGATADDEEDGLDLPVTNITGTVHTNTLGTYVVHYNFTDSDGAAAVEVTRTVNVNPVVTECNDKVDNDGDDAVDYPSDLGCSSAEDNDENNKPVITLTGSDPVNLTVGDSYTDAGATANDAEDGVITDDIVVGGDTVDPNTVGTYVITYNVQDSDGLAADQVTRTVNVNREKPALCSIEIVSDTSAYVVEKDANAKLLTFIHDAWDAVITGASWIWGDDPVVDPSVEETQSFQNKFGFVGNVTAATLYVASDNGHSATLNANSSHDGGSTFAAAVSYNVTSEVLQGNNVLNIAVTNEALGTDPAANPAGVMYKLVINGEVTSDADCAVPYQEPGSDPIYGCTNREATNFDPEATEDDGSCVFQTTSGGGGGSAAPRCSLFEVERDGDEVTLNWETRNGTSMIIMSGTEQIYATDDNDIVDEGEFSFDNANAAEFELTVYRGTRNDTCTAELLGLVGPTGQVLGEQVSAVPLGAAAAGAGGTSPVELPRIQTISAILLREVARVAKNG